MMIEIMEPNFQFNDDRGTLVQLVRDGFKQFNVITSHDKVIRGGHYHKSNDEAFYIISGKCIVIVEDAKGEREEYVFGAGDMFKIRPFTMHSFEYLEETMLVSMYSNGVEIEGGMDSYTAFDNVEQAR